MNIEAVIQFKKFRPNTTKNKNKEVINKQRPQSVSRNIDNKILKTSSDIKIFNLPSKSNFRMVRPSSSIRSSSTNKFWNSSNIENIPYKRTEIPPNMNIMSNPIIADFHLSPHQLHELKKRSNQFNKLDWNEKKEFNFLTSIGGSDFHPENLYRTTSMSGASTEEYFTRPVSSITNLEKINQRPFTSKQLINNNLRINSSKAGRIGLPPTSSKGRPVTAVNKASRARPFSSKITLEARPSDIQFIGDDDLIEELIEDSFSLEHSSKNDKQSTQKPKEKSLLTRPKTSKVDSLLANYKKLDVKHYSIKIQAADSDLLDLFDKSQRTRFATLTRIGDNDYYTPFQRIGGFMNFSAKLKLEDLRNIEKHYYYEQNKLSFRVSKTIKNNQNSGNNPHSLFHGFMLYEGDDLSHIRTLNFENTYDPSIFVSDFRREDILDYSIWPKEFREKLATSLANYFKYINSEKIKEEDLPNFCKKRKENILNLIESIKKNTNKHIIRSSVDEVIQLFKETTKHILMEYILRSPDERIRLNINFYPRKVKPSSFIIAERGGFNRKIYFLWVEKYLKTKKFLTRKLFTNNILTSSIIDWSYSFEHVNVFYTKILNMSNIRPKNIFHIQEFIDYQTNYMKKCFHFLRDIYYRGVLLILKKNKYLRRKTEKEKFWSFIGPIESLNSETLKKVIITSSTIETSSDIFNTIGDNNDDNNFEHNIPLIGMDYYTELNDFWSNLMYSDLEDIRLTPSYYAYEYIIRKSKINVNEIIYDSFSDENKLLINNCVTSYVTIFLRKIIEKSIETFSNFISSHKVIQASIFENDSSANIFSDIVYAEKDIRLPNLKAFNILDEVNPKISIKTTFDQIYNTIKFEMNIDKITEMFIKLIDNALTLFSTTCTSHLLEFKEIPPSEYEKIQKRHWNKLNQIFFDIKVKTFVEDYFKNFCPNLIVEEITNQNYLKTYLNVTRKDEEYYLNLKNKLSKTLKLQLFEIEESLLVFEPVKDLYQNTLQEMVQGFILSIGNVPDYNKFNALIEKIKKYKKYIITIPNHIYYALFCVDNIKTKEDLLVKCDSLMNALFNKFEEMIIDLYNKSIDKYYKIYREIDRKLTTPEEVVEMEKIKTNLYTDLTIIQKNIDDAGKIQFFLLQIDHLFSDIIILKTQEMATKHQSFKVEYEEIDKMHQKDKEDLIIIFKEQKETLEKDIKEYVQTVNNLDLELHITDYKDVLILIENISSNIDPIGKRIDKILNDEELLFSFKMFSFENFENGNKKLEKYKNFWIKVNMFYEQKKEILTNFNTNINIIENVNFINTIEKDLQENKLKLKKTEEVLLKLTKTVEDDIDMFRSFLLIVNSILNGDYYDKLVRQRIIYLLESKKLESTCRQILTYLINQKKISLV